MGASKWELEDISKGLNHMLVSLYSSLHPDYTGKKGQSHTKPLSRSSHIGGRGMIVVIGGGGSFLLMSGKIQSAGNPARATHDVVFRQSGINATLLAVLLQSHHVSSMLFSLDIIESSHCSNYPHTISSSPQKHSSERTPRSCAQPQSLPEDQAVPRSYWQSH